MMPKSSTRGRLARAVLTAWMLTVTGGVAGTAQPSPDALLGTWAIQGGAEEGGPEIQIRIESIDERGRATDLFARTARPARTPRSSASSYGRRAA